MVDKTKIEWTDATWNPITGCSVVSPGCTNCYAMKLAGTRLKHHPSRAGLTNPSKAGPVWNGKVTFNGKWLDQPMRWKKPRMIFVCAHGDLFAENVPDEWIDKVFAVMALCPQHTFQVLTKRADRMRDYMLRCRGRIKDLVSDRHDRAWPLDFYLPIGPERFAKAERRVDEKWPLHNIWHGVSVEDKPRADERIPALLNTPAAVRFISAEPLLGPGDLRKFDFSSFNWHRCACEDDEPQVNALEGSIYCAGCCERPETITTKLDWVIVGGESGRGARPMHPEWVRDLRNQCQSADVPFFFKQWGEWMPRTKCLPMIDGEVTSWPDGTIGRGDANSNGGFGWPLLRVGKKVSGRQLDGREWSEMPDQPRTA